MPALEQPSPPLGNRPALDGVRALAVLLVAGVHTHPRLVPGGSIGVDVFFVLSGFLITTLLVEELDRLDRIHFGRFYARRALRLLPALGALLAVVLVWAVFVATPQTRHDALMEVLVTVSYTRNFTFWAHVPGPLLGHTWSLALEEQFYLLWPLLLTVLVRPRRSAVRWAWLFIGVFVLCSLLRAEHVAGLGQILIQRPEALLLGAAVALLRREYGTRWEGTTARAAASGAVVAGSVGLVALGMWNGADSLFSPGYTGAAVLAAALILGLVVLDGAGPARWFQGRWAVQFGRMSYGFYLWHMPVLRWVDDRMPSTAAAVRIPLGLALALVATVLSYRFVERPALRWKERFRAPDPVAAALHP